MVPARLEIYKMRKQRGEKKKNTSIHQYCPSVLSNGNFRIWNLKQWIILAVGVCRGGRNFKKRKQLLRSRRKKKNNKNDKVLPLLFLLPLLLSEYENLSPCYVILLCIHRYWIKIWFLFELVILYNNKFHYEKC